jgi:isopenicillin N synthase-like dioxygenase
MVASLRSEYPTDLDKRPIAVSKELGSSVPIIDVAGLRSHDCGDTIADMAVACREWGFFQIINHGIADQLIDDVWRQTRQFFSEPRENKEAILRTRENPWGYYNNELTKNQRDKKEVFDYTSEGTDPIYRSRNRWPVNDGKFRSTLLAYFDACTELSLHLLEAFCVGLDLAPDYLHKFFLPEHTGFIRLNHYPVADPMAAADIPDLPAADMGVHHHTDAGAMTILLQDDVGGLQVYQDGQWHDIPPVEGAFVINTGDMMQVWSNDLYRAATHRVLAMESRDRYSIPFFFNPASHATVSPLPSVVADSRPRVYRSIDWAEFRARRTDGDYADYGTEVQISQYRL